ncbi:MAG: hypothetical protein LBT43_01680 [Prevotella sp.]|nr:hypothetical protein [Prevotella sp.]
MTEKKVAEGKRPKNWQDYIWDNLNSDITFDVLYNIFASPNPIALIKSGALLKDAVYQLKKILPSVPNKEFIYFIQGWVEHHEQILKSDY